MKPSDFIVTPAQAGAHDILRNHADIMDTGLRRYDI
jgi:hypothetical protein